MTTEQKRAKKRSYHHGDLEEALLQAALQIIEKQGVEALSIREVGRTVGASRTALYRHYPSKNALLAQVATTGFRKLHIALHTSFSRAETEGRDPLEEAAVAYVRFAYGNPSHYRVMFGPVITGRDAFPELVAEGGAAFGVLVDGIRYLQYTGRIKERDPLRLAQIVWAEVHGLAMLGINGQLAHKRVKPEAADEVTRDALRTMRAGFGTIN